MDVVCDLTDNHYAGVFEGDDSLTRWSHMDVQLMEKSLARLGVATECEIVDTPGSAGYCSTYWSDDYDIVCEPVKVLCQFPFSDSKLALKVENHEGLLSAKAMSLAYRAPGCPIIHALAKKYIRTEGIYDTSNIYEQHWMSQFSEKLSSKANVTKCAFKKEELLREPTPKQRELFERTFQITPQEQMIIEDLIQKHDGLHDSIFEVLRNKPKSGEIDHYLAAWHVMRIRSFAQEPLALRGLEY